MCDIFFLDRYELNNLLARTKKPIFPTIRSPRQEKRPPDAGWPEPHVRTTEGGSASPGGIHGAPVGELGGGNEFYAVWLLWHMRYFFITRIIWISLWIQFELILEHVWCLEITWLDAPPWSVVPISLQDMADSQGIRKIK